MKTYKQELKTVRERIGQNIHEIRRSKKITLRKLSRMAEININMLDQYELGKNNLQVETLVKIANALSVPAEQIWRG